MAYLKVLSLMLISSVASEVLPNPEVRPEMNVLVDRYDIKFTLYTDDDNFYGEYNVSIHISSETQNIYVYKENLFITEIMITKISEISKENGEAIIHRPDKIIYYTRTDITITFPFNLSSGDYTLNMKFIGLVAENGGFRTLYIDNTEDQQNNTIWLAVTHYNKFATRRLFPLLKGSLLSSYRISIKHHKQYTALSNMPELFTNTDKNNMISTNFETTPSMYGYLIGAAVTDLSYIRIITKSNYRNVRWWCRSSMLSYLEFAYSVAYDITLFLETKLSFTKETWEINHIVIPKLSDENEITLGFVLHKEADIISDREDSEGRKLEIIQSIGFKVAHEWVYNVILPYMWEDNPWFREGFAMFLGIYAANMNFPSFRIQDLFVVQTQHELLHWYTKDIWPFNSGFNNSIEIPRYIKASIMFRTLQTTLTEEVFWNGIEMYSHNRSNRTNNDFWIAMQAAMDESLLCRFKYNIKVRMVNWEQLKHYPVVNVKRNYNTNSLHISIENINETILDIPVSIITHSNLNITSHTLWLDTLRFPNDTLHIIFEDENDWVLVNLQQSGCYRVNYDVENWNKLSRYLNSKSFKNIHVLDRAKIIDDTFHFLMTGQLNFDIFLNISRYLGRDIDYIAWYPMLKNLEYLSAFFALPESASIKNILMIPLTNIAREINYPSFRSDNIDFRETEGNVVIKFLREEVVKWSCTIGYTYCLLIANDELNWYLDHKSSSREIWKKWTGSKEWILCNGLKTANNDTWTKVFNIYRKEFDNSVLKYLSCSQNVDIIRRYLHMMRNGVRLSEVTVLDYINTFTSIIAKHANTNSLLDTILETLKKISLPSTIREISVATTLTMIINHVYSIEQLNKIKKYVEINFNHTSMSSLINHEDLYSQNNDTMRKYIQYKKKYREDVIMYVKRKLELRWNQIKTRLMEFRYFVKNLDDILRQNLDD